MNDLSRRTVLTGLGAAAVTSALPALAQTAVMPFVRMVKTNGINLAVYEAGQGPALVLLHGFPGLAFTWRHQIPAFAAAGYRVIVPDMRGYGRWRRATQGNRCFRVGCLMTNWAARRYGPTG